MSVVPLTRQSRLRCRVIIRAGFRAVSYRYYVLLNSILLLCGFCAQAAAQENTPATVQGTVFNKVSGAPVNHAHVMYIKSAAGAHENPTPISTDTDSEGHFVIQVEPGTYRLWVERPGFARQPYGARTPEGAGAVLTLAPRQQVRDITIKLAPLGAISGRTLDNEGEPVQGVGIQVLRFSYANGKRRLMPVSGASSNDRGEYRVFGLPAGRYYLLATLHGAPMSHLPDTGGLVPEMLDPFAPLYYPGVLDPTAATMVPLPEGGEASDIDFNLQRIRAVTVRGRVYSSIPDFSSSHLQVVLAHNEGNTASGVGRLTATLDPATGRFEFRGVAPGEYLLLGAQQSNKLVLSGREAIEVTAAAIQDNFRLTLSPGYAISGRVEMEGGAAANLSHVMVQLVSTEDIVSGLDSFSRIGPDGSIHMPGVTAGIWMLFLDQLAENVWIKSASYGEQDLLLGDLNASTGPVGQIHIVLAGNGAQISGTVVDNDQPREAIVVLVPAADELRRSLGLYRVTSSENRGTFVFKGVRPGSYKLFAFEEVEPFAWFDPEFLKPVESLGESVTVGEGEKITKQLTPVPPESLLPQR
ncbi:MAG: hypothetical protein DMG65_12915 [Candidatus Angelobacter sp. Gp1-AA117]|nr:MAG: hypothetical protein DMG65_12915 [Candidatus Angelobacter sp. Gp1-AA117]